MGKWLIKVTREIEEPFSDVMDSEQEPTQPQIIAWLAREHYITDNPDYTKYEIVKKVEL